MPSLKDHQSAQTTKLLFIGETGTGKTGGLAALASAGYNLRIVDLDNGLDVLKNILTHPQSPYPAEALDRIKYVTMTDEMKPAAGKLVPVKATVWTRTINLLSHWKEETKGPDGKVEVVPGSDLGPITSWGPNDILVIDSLSRLSDAALAFHLSLVGRLGGKIEQSDWFMGQGLVENMLKMLYNAGVACNVIVLCHIDYRGEEGQPTKGYPRTLGKALNPKVGEYFNTMLQAVTKGYGAQARKVILTRPTSLVELKTSIPLSVPPEYPMEHGLATYFRDIRQGRQPVAWEYKGPIPLGPLAKSA